MNFKKLITKAKASGRYSWLMQYVNERLRLQKFIENKTLFLNDVYENISLNQRLYHFIHQCGIHKCKHCEKQTNYKGVISKGYYNTCGDSVCWDKETKQTNIEKYGHVSVMGNEIVKKKHENSCLKNHGSTSYLGTKEAVKKRKEKIEFDFKSNNKNITKVTDTSISLMCNDCKKEVELPKYLFFNRTKYRLKLCTECNPIGSHWSSNAEDELVTFIQGLGITNIIRRSKKIIKYHELDIYLPDFNIAIEYNGLYWHSEIYKDKNYHLKKTTDCELNGIKLIHIWEDDWNFKMDIVKSRIRNALGKTDNIIYARKCIIREIISSEEKRFLEENHLQGYVASNFKIGLFYQNELVSLMTFSKPRNPLGQRKKIGFMELLRMCNKTNTNVIGAASRLLKYFLKTVDCKEIISYADRSWSSKNSVYEKIGFELLGETVPNYHYLIDRQRKHRFGFNKQKLVLAGADIKKTEHEIMLERKIYRIYGCGSFKYLLKI